MKLKSPKQKGSRLERRIAEDLRHSGLDTEARRMPLSGAFDTLKSDILTSLPLSIECKNQETWNPLKYYEQAESGAKQQEIPLVIMGKNNTQPFAFLSWDHFMQILLYAKSGGWTQELLYSKHRQTKRIVKKG